MIIIASIFFAHYDSRKLYITIDIEYMNDQIEFYPGINYIFIVYIFLFYEKYHDFMSGIDQWRTMKKKIKVNI